MKEQAQQWWNQGTKLAQQGQQQPALLERMIEQLSIRDPHTSPKLRGQLIEDLRQYSNDPRAQSALDNISE